MSEERFAPDLADLLVPIESLTPDPRNPRRHVKKDIAAIRASLRLFGQRKPIVAKDGVVIAGNGTLRAAREEGWKRIARVDASHWTKQQATAFGIADNRIPELGTWDVAMLAAELEHLIDEDFELKDLGFDEREHEAFLREAGLLEAPELEGEGKAGAREPESPGEAPGSGTGHVRMVQLFLGEKASRAFARAIEDLQGEYGTETLTDTVVRAMEREDAA